MESGRAFGNSGFCPTQSRSMQGDAGRRPVEVMESRPWERLRMGKCQSEKWGILPTAVIQPECPT